MRTGDDDFPRKFHGILVDYVPVSQTVTDFHSMIQHGALRSFEKLTAETLRKTDPRMPSDRYRFPREFHALFLTYTAGALYCDSTQ